MYYFKYFFLTISLFVSFTVYCDDSLAKTTEFSLGDTITWSISGVSDAQIHCEAVVQDASTMVERVMCGSASEIRVDGKYRG